MKKIKETDLKKLAYDITQIIDNCGIDLLSFSCIEKIRTRTALYRFNFFIKNEDNENISSQFIYGKSKRDLFEKMIILYERLIIEYGLHNYGDYYTARYSYYLSISPIDYIEKKDIAFPLEKI